MGPLAWKATAARGTRTCQRRPPFGSFFSVTIVAATTMRASWIAYEAIRTHRFRGVKKRWKRAKKKEPRQKDAIDMPDFIQRIPSWGATIPRPRYTVLP